MKELPEEELQDHPPPEFNHPHVVTKYRTGTVATKVKHLLHALLFIFK